MKLGGYDYLLKPCSVDELMDKIDGAHERKLAREKRKEKAPVQPAIDGEEGGQ
jgi:FixJ family two-component response regulator